jgi:hypothetical protein
MPRKPSGASRPSEVVMDELAGEQTPWDLEKHLSGCLAGYQTDPRYGAAVYFALEALWGIACDVEFRANSGNLTTRVSWMQTGRLPLRPIYPCHGCGFARWLRRGQDTRATAGR